MESLKEFKLEVEKLIAGKQSKVNREMFSLAGSTAMQIFSNDNEYMSDPANEEIWHAAYFAIYKMIESTTTLIKEFASMSTKHQPLQAPQQHQKRWNGNN